MAWELARIAIILVVLVTMVIGIILLLGGGGGGILDSVKRVFRFGR